MATRFQPPPRCCIRPWGFLPTSTATSISPTLTTIAFAKWRAAGRISTFAGTGTGGEGPDDLLAAQTELRGPRNVCIGLTGTIYIVDTSNHRVLSVLPGGYAATFAGNGTAGLGGDGGPARTAELNQPGACTVDSTGNLFIADTLNHRIAKVDTSGIITTRRGNRTGRNERRWRHRRGRRAEFPVRELRWTITAIFLCRIRAIISSVK